MENLGMNFVSLDEAYNDLQIFEYGDISFATILEKKVEKELSGKKTKTWEQLYNNLNNIANKKINEILNEDILEQVSKLRDIENTDDKLKIMESRLKEIMKERDETLKVIEERNDKIKNNKLEILEESKEKEEKLQKNTIHTRLLKTYGLNTNTLSRHTKLYEKAIEKSLITKNKKREELEKLSKGLNDIIKWIDNTPFSMQESINTDNLLKIMEVQIDEYFKKNDIEKKIEEYKNVYSDFFYLITLCDKFFAKSMNCTIC